MRFTGRSRLQLLILTTVFTVCFGVQCAPTQESSPSTNPKLDSASQMQQQLNDLKMAMNEMKAEEALYRAQAGAQILDLKQQLRKTQEKLESTERSLQAAVGALAPNAEKAAPDHGPDSQSTDKSQEEQQVQRLQDNQQLLASKVDEQYQSKVESGSKYRVKIFGMILMNTFSNQGNVDHIEVPSVALAATPFTTKGSIGGSFGATLRQSQLGLEVYGPSIAGATTRGDFVADFFGAFPEINNGAAGGSLRVRTGTVRMDWQRTSIVAGMDNLFFSPTYATSYASLGIPAFAYSGDIWAWMPQIRVEHRLLESDSSNVTVSGGILDGLTGEAPPSDFLRLPGAGESRRQPAYASRIDWSHRAFGEPLKIGIGGYYNRENWAGHNIDGWAATIDWAVPLGKEFGLSGKVYRGLAIGGLGAGLGNSILSTGPLTDPTTAIRALRSVGGWSQFKFRPTTKLEFNVAAGQDDAFAADARGFTVAPGYLAANLIRNRSELANVIYRPRSNLLLSAEFRALRTFTIQGTSQRANQVNLIMGVLF
ncbi:MAG TPA: hypothetical protein VKY85_08065 [Candidatus Angelobacter sp.]|nr:hypothetical protein [Candidatus Angelobacter sp.]